MFFFPSTVYQLTGLHASKIMRIYGRLTQPTHPKRLNSSANYHSTFLTGFSSWVCIWLNLLRLNTYKERLI